MFISCISINFILNILLQIYFYCIHQLNYLYIPFLLKVHFVLEVLIDLLITYFFNRICSSSFKGALAK